MFSTSGVVQTRYHVEMQSTNTFYEALEIYWKREAVDVFVSRSALTFMASLICFVDISGVPGTGKTATVHAVIRELMKMAENNVCFLFLTK